MDDLPATQQERHTSVRPFPLSDCPPQPFFIAMMHAADLVQPGAYLSLHDASTEVVRGSMRLVVGKQGKVEAASGGENFKAAVSKRCMRWKRSEQAHDTIQKKGYREEKYRLGRGQI